jgi:uncharacterized protein with NRDE domain
MDNQTLTLDGVTYEVARFSQPVQQAVGIYNTFNAQLQTEQLAVLKTQAALQSVAAQIAEAIKKELATEDPQFGKAAEAGADAAVAGVGEAPAA